MLLQWVLVCTLAAQSLLLSCKTDCPRETPSPPSPPSAAGAYNPTFCVYGALGPCRSGLKTFVLPCLAYVTEHNAFRLHPCCSLSQNCLPFRLGNIHCVDGPWSACLFFCRGRDTGNVYIHLSRLVIFVE